MIALDASVLIAQLDDTDALHAGAVQVLRDHEEHLFVCSTMTVAEVLVQPARMGRTAAARAGLTRLAVAEVGLPADAAERLARLRAETGLRLPDCCVLLAAEEAGADEVLAFDERLTRVARERGF